MSKLDTHMRRHCLEVLLQEVYQRIRHVLSLPYVTTCDIMFVAL